MERSEYLANLSLVTEDPPSWALPSKHAYKVKPQPSKNIVLRALRWIWRQL
jgi:hypothetical protein